MLHGFRFALGLLAAGGLAAALLGCKNAEVSPRKESRDEVRPQPATPVAPAPSPAPEAAPQLTVQTSQQGLPGADTSKEMVLDTTSGKTPEGWPSEVPLYPGAKINMSMKLPRGFTLTMETPDPTTKVSEYYRTQLASMQQVSAVDVAQGQTLMWSNPSKPLTVTLALSAAGAVTRVTLVVTSSK